MKSHLKFAAMQRFSTLVLGLLLSVTAAFASVTGFDVEVHATSEYGTTYRLYATFDDPGDWVSSIYGLTGGEGNLPMSLLATGGASIYHTSNGFNLNPNFGQEINPMFAPLVDDYYFDSWLTIGAEDNSMSGPQGAGMDEAFATFNTGSGFDNCGGAWFVASTSGPAAHWVAGEDGRVLLAHITMTDDSNGNPGHFDFQLNMQWKDASGTTSYFEGDQMSSSDFITDLPGCMDDAACNYNASASTDDGSCIIPDASSCEICEEGLAVVADSDEDGICDADEILGCQDDTACNYNAEATDAGTCDYATAACEVCIAGTVVLQDADGDGTCDGDEIDGCTDDSACNYSATATEDDGTCEFLSCQGCTDNTACNFDAGATQDDGSCEFTSCYGCMDDTACNYVAGATQDSEDCTYPATHYDCNGDCLNDTDGDGTCDELEIVGCEDETACNYNAAATENAGCIYPPIGGDCDSECEGDFDGDGVCDNFEVPGCTSSTATNYNATATDDDGTCVWTDEFFTGLSYEVVGYNTVGDATTYRVYAEFNSDAIQMQACYGTSEWPWELTSTAPFIQQSTGGLLGHNINPAFFPVIEGLVYDSWFAFGAGPGDSPGPADIGLDVFTADFTANGGDVIVNTAVGASIYYTPDASPFAFPQDGKILLGQFTTEGVVSVKYNFQFRDSEHVTHVVNDLNLTFPANLPGCKDETACNYDMDAEFATNDECTFALGCDECSGATDGTGTVIDNDADDDGVCDVDEIDGCTDATACNYDATPTTDTNNDLCIYPTGCQTCSGETDGTGTVNDNDADDDGVCDADEIEGCTDATACNYDATPTTDTNNDLCIYATGCDTCIGATDGTGTIVDNDADDDGVCDAYEIEGCTDATACNYDATPTTDTNNDLCTYAEGCDTCSGQTDGTGTVVDNDADNDGVCDADEVEGCTDATACNYDATPTTDTNNDLCVYATGCDECSGATDGTGTVIDNDQDNDGVCDADEVPGCTNDSAQNYDPAATDDDGTCILGDCNDPLACNYVADGDNPNPDACTYAEPFFDCEGNCIGDYEGDGICEGEEIWGCASSSANNFDPEATNDDGSCEWGEGMFEGLSYEVVTTHEEGPLAGSGYVTYRIYAEFSTADIDLVQLFGNATHPWLIANTGDTYQDAYGSEYGGNIAPALFALVPTAEYDSWLTIGAAPGEYNAMNQSGMYAYFPTWNSGGDFHVNNTAASISVTPLQSDQGVPDENGRVLLAQITANGVGFVRYNVLFQPEVGAAITYTDVELTFPAQVPGCTNDLALNYQANANSDDGSCLVEGCTDADAINYDPTANLQDGSCLFNGCTNDAADNFDPDANIDDGSCLFTGCSDEAADNYDPLANTGDQTALCEYFGCMNEVAINYDAGANVDDGSCLILGCYDPEADNYNPAANTGNQTTICRYYGCTDPDAANYDPEANFNDGSCDYLGCTDNTAINFDGAATIDDGSCEYPGCTDADADNFDPEANVDDGSCLFTGCYDEAADNYDLFANTGDQAALCEYWGCTDEVADNFDPQANVDDDSCVYFGCTDEFADNFDPGANADDGSCIYFGCTDPDADNFELGANEDDGSCIYLGCTAIEADNYDAGATEDDGSCVFTGCMDENADNYWSMATTGDQEALCEYLGCTLADAENFDPTANVNDGSCILGGCLYLDAANYNADATYDDGSCIFQTVGCTDPTAWNYMETALDDNGTCLYGGCTYDIAFNFDPDVTVDDGSCEWMGCTDTQAVNFDADASHDDGSCEVVGCMDEEGINYNADATFSGYCEYPDVCPGDINGDSSVDVQDLLTFFQYYGSSCE